MFTGVLTGLTGFCPLEAYYTPHMRPEGQRMPLCNFFPSCHTRILWRKFLVHAQRVFAMMGNVMKRALKNSACILMLGPIAAFAVPAPPTPTPAPAAPAAALAKSAESSTNAAHIKFQEMVHDFGKVKANEPLRTDFLFTN